MTIPRAGREVARALALIGAVSSLALIAIRPDVLSSLAAVLTADRPSDRSPARPPGNPVTEQEIDGPMDARVDGKLPPGGAEAYTCSDGGWSMRLPNGTEIADRESGQVLIRPKRGRPGTSPPTDKAPAQPQDASPGRPTWLKGSSDPLYPGNSAKFPSRRRK